MFCTKCGKEINDNAKFCGYCGNVVEMGPPTLKKKMPKTIIFLIVAVAAIIVCIIAVAKSGILVSYSNERCVQSALKDVVEQMDALSVKISCSHEATGINPNGVEAEAYSEDSAVVDFQSDEAYFSEGRTYFSLTPVPFDGTSHVEKSNVEVYCSANGNVFRKIDNTEFCYVTDADALEISECLWFFEDIQDDIADAEIIETDEDTIKVTGTIKNATKICDTYVKFIDLLGDGPEYKSTNRVNYELLIDKTTKKVESICFDLSDIAAYVWYGEQYGETGIRDISGQMQMEYMLLNDSQDFTIPDALDSLVEASTEELSMETEANAQTTNIGTLPKEEILEKFLGFWVWEDEVEAYQAGGGYNGLCFEKDGSGYYIFETHGDAWTEENLTSYSDKELVFEWDDELSGHVKVTVTYIDENIIEEVFQSELYNDIRRAIKDSSIGEIEDLDANIEQIRTWYYDTQNRLDSLLYASYDPNLDCYFDGAYPVKVVAKKGYNDWNVTREYYYHDQKLYFIFVYGDIGEYRFYVKDGVLIRSISPDGNTVDIGYGAPQEVWDISNRAFEEEKNFPLMINCGA